MFFPFLFNKFDFLSFSFISFPSFLSPFLLFLYFSSSSKLTSVALSSATIFYIFILHLLSSAPL